MASSTITSDVTDEIERNTLKMDEPESSHQAKESEEICSAPCNLFVNATCKGETGGSPDNKEAGLESSELVDDGSICSNIANSENVSQFFQDPNAPDQVETSSLNNGKVEPPKQSQAPSVGVGKVLDQLNVSGLGQLCVYVSEDSDDSEDCETDISSAAVVHITHPASLEEGVSAFIKRQSDSSLESSDSSSSDWEFHSDTGSASSEEEEEEEDDHGAQDAQGQAQMLEVDKGAKKVGPLRTNGEITLDDLPPIEDLHISVPEEDCKELGKVCSIVDKLVVVQPNPNTPTLNLDSVLFLECGKRALGHIFDVFGQVKAPYYCVRFNSPEHIETAGVQVGTIVYCAPKSPYTEYVFLNQLLSMRGSDASWKHNNEPPPRLLDYSDDEEERQARRVYIGKTKQPSREEHETTDQPLSKRPSLFEEVKNRRNLMLNALSQRRQHRMARAGAPPAAPPPGYGRGFANPEWKVVGSNPCPTPREYIIRPSTFPQPPPMIPIALQRGFWDVPSPAGQPQLPPRSSLDSWILPQPRGPFPRPGGVRFPPLAHSGFWPTVATQLPHSGVFFPQNHQGAMVFPPPHPNYPPPRFNNNPSTLFDPSQPPPRPRPHNSQTWKVD
uniref:H/ACA ribonucleoprotein complex non-core subunit NAF1 n=1 Tax=Timema californicum TaxID=61474 RepID=A0A7R9J3Q7_TIMCA|nr:unnamed protein product [Timema californicum]